MLPVTDLSVSLAGVDPTHHGQHKGSHVSCSTLTLSNEILGSVKRNSQNNSIDTPQLHTTRYHNDQKSPSNHLSFFSWTYKSASKIGTAFSWIFDGRLKFIPHTLLSRLGFLSNRKVKQLLSRAWNYSQTTFGTLTRCVSWFCVTKQHLKLQPINTLYMCN